MLRNLQIVIAGGVLAPTPTHVLTLYETRGWALAATDNFRPAAGTYTFDNSTGALVLVQEDGSPYAAGVLDEETGTARIVATNNVEYILAKVESD